MKHDWAMRDGGRIAINKMSDHHLQNTIRMLERQHGRMISDAWAEVSALQGDMACYYAEGGLDQMEQVGSMHPTYGALCDEALERGLDWGGKP